MYTMKPGVVCNMSCRQLRFYAQRHLADALVYGTGSAEEDSGSETESTAHLASLKLLLLAAAEHCCCPRGGETLAPIAGSSATLSPRNVFDNEANCAPSNRSCGTSQVIAGTALSSEDKQAETESSTPVGCREVMKMLGRIAEDVSALRAGMPFPASHISSTANTATIIPGHCLGTKNGYHKDLDTGDGGDRLISLVEGKQTNFDIQLVEDTQNTLLNRVLAAKEVDLQTCSITDDKSKACLHGGMDKQSEVDIFGQGEMVLFNCESANSDEQKDFEITPILLQEEFVLPSSSHNSCQNLQNQEASLLQRSDCRMQTNSIKSKGTLNLSRAGCSDAAHQFETVSALANPTQSGSLNDFIINGSPGPDGLRKVVCNSLTENIDGSDCHKGYSNENILNEPQASKPAVPFESFQCNSPNSSLMEDNYVQGKLSNRESKANELALDCHADFEKSGKLAEQCSDFHIIAGSSVRYIVGSELENTVSANLRNNGWACRINPLVLSYQSEHDEASNIMQSGATLR